ncbi:MAG: MerR family transcriptional regulator [Bacteroidota bacterium]
MDVQLTQQYYTIGEVAKLFTVSTSLLRYWEKTFTSLHPQKDTQGIRKYTREDVVQLQIIYQLVKEQGYTLRGAKEVLASDTKRHKKSKEVIASLKKVRGFLVMLRERLS